MNVAQNATPAEIASALITDEEARPDGWTNRERVAFVLTTFDADTIDFEEVFDFGLALSCYEPAVVEAWRQLAILQGIYAETLYVYQWLDEEEFFPIHNHLIAVVQHLDWHIYSMFNGTDKELVVLHER